MDKLLDVSLGPLPHLPLGAGVQVGLYLCVPLGLPGRSPPPRGGVRPSNASCPNERPGPGRRPSVVLAVNFPIDSQLLSEGDAVVWQ